MFYYSALPVNPALSNAVISSLALKFPSTLKVSTPLVTVSVLTPVGLDHTQYLGATLAEIAAEKAGIIKPGVPVISAPQLPEAERVIGETARRMGARLKFITQPLGKEWPLAQVGFVVTLSGNILSPSPSSTPAPRRSTR